MHREALRRRVRLLAQDTATPHLWQDEDIDDWSTRPSRRPRFGSTVAGSDAGNASRAVRIPLVTARPPSPFQIRSTRSPTKSGSRRAPAARLW